MSHARGRSAGQVERPAPVDRTGGPETAAPAQPQKDSSLGPLIYYASPLLIGPESAWDAHFERIAGLGFDTVLIALPFSPGPDGNLFHTTDHDSLHPALRGDGPGQAAPFLAALARRAKARGLALGLDLVLDHVASGANLAAEHPHWFRAPGRRDDAPDPRRPGESGEIARFLLDSAAIADEVAAHFAHLLGAWREAGIACYRCLGVDRIPADFGRKLIDAAKRQAEGSRFLAWTPGLSDERVRLLAQAGFDHCFASTPWWDGREAWLLREYSARRLVLPPIGLVEDPGGPRAASGAAPAAASGNAAGRAALARQRLWLAALTGAGLMMPMGFEHGARAPLDMRGGEPADWDWLVRQAEIDLSADIRAVTDLLRREPLLRRPGHIEMLSGAGSGLTVLARSDQGDHRSASRIVVIAANVEPSGRPATFRPETALPAVAGRFPVFRDVRARTEQPLTPGQAIRIAPHEIALFTGESAGPLGTAGTVAASEAARAPRPVIEAIGPTAGEPRFAVKRLAGEVMTVEADVYGDGHEKLRAVIRWRGPGDADWREAEMALVVNDRWRGTFPLERIGRHRYTVEAWRDLFATWLDEVEKKHGAGLALGLELREGRALVEAAMSRAKGPDRDAFARLCAALERASEGEALSLLSGQESIALMRRWAERTQAFRYPAEFAVMADRREAQFASWYELFPRSQSGDPDRHGTFDDVIARLPYIRQMGFDVLYFTPIHPIGRVNRKGKNNTLTPSPTDPGSPYAIGAAEGGHDAVHPELGGIEAFRRLTRAAAEQGLEIALDFAIQCSPDHPWLKQHPGWFDWRPDGSLRYAENPPKKYEDIVNVDFYAPDAVPSLWEALRDVILYWAGEGVRTFRVDNPHTKPLPFWEWMIGDVQARYPDALFLSEAFTRPKMMKRLAKVGFTQSYTYFTWRNTKQEITEYLTELTTTDMRDYFRPHFFVNTPDINPVFLQTSGRAGFLIRAALATTLSGLWGMYSGFELCEARALPGKEEYLDSEKYEIRAWDWDRPGNIISEIARLNRIRKENPALHTHMGLSFLNCWNDQVVCFRKMTPERDNLLVVAISMDPHQPQEASFEVPLWDLGLPDPASVAVEDLMREQRWTWSGKVQRVRLDPGDLPFAVWRISPASGSATA